MADTLLFDCQSVRFLKHDLLLLVCVCTEDYYLVNYNGFAYSRFATVISYIIIVTAVITVHFPKLPLNNRRRVVIVCMSNAPEFFVLKEKITFEGDLQN